MTKEDEKSGSFFNTFNPFTKNDINHSAAKKPSSVKTQQHNGLTWIDIENPTQQEIAKLAHDYPFHPLHLEDSLLVGSLPQLEKEASYLFLLLHVPIFDKNGNKIIASQIAVFLGKDYLITIHTDTAPNVKNLFVACEQDEQQRNNYFKKSTGYLLYNVIKILFEGTAGLVKIILHELDEAEDNVFDSQKSDANLIAELRQKILRLRRTIEPLKTVTVDLAPNVHELTNENLSHHYREINRLATWLSEIVGEAEETIEIYKDADFTASTERTNEILAVLTILFTLAIPATMIGTFYGMNVLLPGGIAVGSWRFFGQYTTLIVIAVLSAIPALGMYWYFKRKHWF
ncbi:MAG TPA: magnesium transporter CorA family protein [Patescibacteria group bacterium]|nr:magnesium transporter CorA family protein [Patescibacteria group bacterium]